MTFKISDSGRDLRLIFISGSDGQAILHTEPNTYYNACRPSIWIAETAVNVGDMVRPGTNNGFVYECTVSGVTGTLEPSWGLVQDAEFTDGTATWLTHENYALSNITMLPGDYVLGDDPENGRRLSIDEKTGVTTHTTGDVTHMALYCDSDKSLRYVGEAETSLVENNTVTSGRATIFQAFYIQEEDPVEVI